MNIGQITSISIGGKPIEFNGTVTASIPPMPGNDKEQIYFPLRQQWSGEIKLSKKKGRKLQRMLKAYLKKERIPRKVKKRGQVLVCKLKKLVRKHYQRNGRPKVWALNTKK